MDHTSSLEFPECPQHARSDLWTSYVLASRGALQLAPALVETAFQPQPKTLSAFSPLPRLSTLGVTNLSLAPPPGMYVCMYAVDGLVWSGLAWGGLG